jgi:hypothetical protein
VLVAVAVLVQRPLQKVMKPKAVMVLMVGILMVSIQFLRGKTLRYMLHRAVVVVKVTGHSLTMADLDGITVATAGRRD